MSIERSSAARELTSADDEKGMASLIASLVVSGDISRLNDVQRAWYYRYRCEQLGLDPASKPFDILRLQGKDILYLNRGGTDQLARIHKVNRRVLDGPKIVDINGAKFAYVLIEATTPDGRSEQEVATIPLADPANLFMKVLSKGKRRATIAITGAGALDESELETIPDSEKAPARAIDISVVEPRRATPDVLQRVLDDSEQAETVEQLRAIADDHWQALVDADSESPGATNYCGRARNILYDRAHALGLVRTKGEFDAKVLGKGQAPKPAVVETQPAPPPSESDLISWVAKARSLDELKAVGKDADTALPKGSVARKRFAKVYAQRLKELTPDGGPEGGAPRPANDAPVDVAGEREPGSDDGDDSAHARAEAAWREHLAEHGHAFAIANSVAKHDDSGEFAPLSADQRARIAIGRIVEVSQHTAHPVGEMGAMNLIRGARAERARKHARSAA